MCRDLRSEIAFRAVGELAPETGFGKRVHEQMMVERVGKVKSNPDEALRWPGHTSISASRKINDIEGRASPRGGAAHGGWRRFLARGSLDAMEKGGALHERAQDSRASVILL